MMRALGNLVPFVIQPPNMVVTHPKIRNDSRYWPWFKLNRRRRYHGPKELFNHRHSSLRNVIERTFGVLKQRFPLLKHMPRYDMNQVKKMKMTMKTKMKMKVQVKFRVKLELKMSTEMKMEYQQCNNTTMSTCHVNNYCIWDNGEMRLQYPCGKHITIGRLQLHRCFLQTMVVVFFVVLIGIIIGAPSSGLKSTQVRCKKIKSHSNHAKNKRRGKKTPLRVAFHAP
ncbi:hypothetical protein CsSME_00011682 [Camellia sinensis var. sinensis]